MASPKLVKWFASRDTAVVDIKSRTSVAEPAGLSDSLGRKALTDAVKAVGGIVADLTVRCPVRVDPEDPPEIQERAEKARLAALSPLTVAQSAAILSIADKAIAGFFEGSPEKAIHWMNANLVDDADVARAQRAAAIGKLCQPRLALEKSTRKGRGGLIKAIRGLDQMVSGRAIWRASEEHKALTAKATQPAAPAKATQPAAPAKAKADKAPAKATQPAAALAS